jgi:hypothetical protein
MLYAAPQWHSRKPSHTARVAEMVVAICAATPGRHNCKGRENVPQNDNLKRKYPIFCIRVEPNKSKLVTPSMTQPYNGAGVAQPSIFKFDDCWLIKQRRRLHLQEISHRTASSEPWSPS